MGRYTRTIVDLGTGDGRAVLRTARACPDTLLIGIDTNAAGLVDTSRRAGANALFLVEDATSALRALEGRVAELRIVLPWGSLLRRVLEGEREFALAAAGAV